MLHKLLERTEEVGLFHKPKVDKKSMSQALYEDRLGSPSNPSVSVRWQLRVQPGQGPRLDQGQESGQEDLQLLSNSETLSHKVKMTGNAAQW